MISQSKLLVGLDPTVPKRAVQERSLASRPATLEGATIALVINGLGRAEELMRAVYARIAARVRDVRCLVVIKPDISVGPPPAEFERIVSQATVAITGFGGCGSCSTRSMRDAMELEWAGIPSVALIHEAVNLGVRMLVKIHGMEDYPYVLVGQPYMNLGEWNDREIEELADIIAPQVIPLLLARQPTREVA